MILSPLVAGSCFGCLAQIYRRKGAPRLLKWGKEQEHPVNRFKVYKTCFGTVTSQCLA